MTERTSMLVRASMTLATVASRQSLQQPVRVTLAAAPAATAAAGSGTEDLKKSEATELEGKDKANDPSRSLLRSVGEQLSFGGTLGLATGYTIRTIGKAALFLVGAEVVVLQYMAHRGWVTVNWDRLGNAISPKFSRSTVDSILDILVYRMPFSAAFTGGLVAGFRLSSTK